MGKFFHRIRSGVPFLSLFTCILVSVALVTMSGCASDKHKIDLEEIDYQIDIMRLEMDLFSADIDSINVEISRLEDMYGNFFSIFNNLIIRIGSSGSPAYPQHLIRFLTDFDIYRLQSEVKRVFPDLEKTGSELESGFRHYIHYFPGKPVPGVYTFVSGFNQSIVTADNIVAIGLDKYLGRDHKFYAELNLPLYQRLNMHPSRIPSDCMAGWAMSEYEFDDVEGNLLSHMIYHGKILYYTDLMLPHQHDTLKTGFTSNQLDWCRNNERQVWTYLVENKLLFSTDTRTIARFINHGPFTTDFSRESPARVAVWVGWQIVRSYMSRNKDVSLQELMLETDYQKILNSARYRP